MLDPELKAYLESMRHDLKEHAERLNQATRQDLTQQMNGMRDALEGQIADSRTHAEHLNQATRQDLMAHADRLNQETRVLLEVLRDDLKGVADGVLSVNEKLDRFQHATDHQLAQLDTRVLRLEAQSSGAS